MLRTFTIFCFGLLALSALNAGQIQIGGSNGTAGLTSNYVNAASGSPCAGSYASGQSSLAGYSGCLATGVGATISGGLAGTNFKNLPDVTSLYVGTTEGGAGLAAPPTSLTANDALGAAVTFDLMNNNIWAGSGGTSTGTVSGVATTTSLIVPVGVFGVDKVWTMLNDYWGEIGAQNTSVTFNFGTTSNQTSGYDSVKFTLTNGNEIRDAVDCSGVSTTPAPDATHTTQYTAAGCRQYAGTTTSANTANAFHSAYNGDTNASSAYFFTSGSVNLDDQLFTFSAARQGEWLDSITISNTGGLAGIIPATSRTALSAITVDTTVVVPTPEPGSIMLILSGIGAIGVSRIRRRR